MKRTAWLMLLGMALAAPGCFGFDKLVLDKDASPPAAPIPAPPPLPVTENDVREDDPQKAVDALTRELDRAAAECTAPPPAHTNGR
jgi:hypothetical protein